MFPLTSRLPTKEVPTPRPNKQGEYYLEDITLNDPKRKLRLFKTVNNIVFGISALVDDTLNLKQVLKEPKRYGTMIHIINSALGALDYIYLVKVKYPLIDSIPVSYTRSSSLGAPMTPVVYSCGGKKAITLYRCDTTQGFATGSLIGNLF